MKRTRGLPLAVLACLMACDGSVLLEDPEAECSFDGDASAGVQGTLRPSGTAVPAASSPGGSVLVGVRVAGVGVGGLRHKEIRWIPGPEGGTVQPAASLTEEGDALGTGRGITQTTWTLPDVADITATLTAEVVNSDPLLRVVFTTATTLPRSPAQVARNPLGFPNPQAGTAGQPALHVPSVTVTDRAGRPLPAVTVTFSVTQGMGSLNSFFMTVLQIPTTANGVATVPTWILGDPGENIVEASAGTLPPVTFTAVAAAASPALTLAIHAGDNQSALVGVAVPIPPRVILRNAQGVGVAGVTITWQVVQGGGSLLPEPAATDFSGPSNAEGIARLQYFAPTSTGAIRLRATVTSAHPVAPQFVEFSFTGLAPS